MISATLAGVRSGRRRWTTVRLDISPPQSLHARLVERHPDISRSVVSKAGMLQVSRGVESVASREADGSVLAVGCQHERYWRMAEAHYAGLGLRPIVAAVPESRRMVPRFSDAVFVPLPHAHALAAEWFVVVLGPATSIVMCGLDRDIVRRHGPAQGSRTFDVVLSTDPAVAHDAIETLGADALFRGTPEAGEVLANRIARAADLPHGKDHTTDALLTAMLRTADRQSRIDRLQRDRRDDELVDTRDRERRRIVNAVHDGSLQNLLAAAQDLEDLEERLGPRDDLRRARETLRGGIVQLRDELSATFNAEATGALHVRLDALRARYGRRGGFDSTITIDEFAPDLHDEDVVACVRELLLNAAKHARASHVRIAVRRSLTPHEIVIDVSDDGVGIPPSVLAGARGGGHLGLSLARVRILDLGGTWSLTTAPGEGVQVRATIPVLPSTAT